jgi:hypothetical protein
MKRLVTFLLFANGLIMGGCVPHSYQKDISARLKKQFQLPNNGNPVNGYVFAAILPEVGTLFCTEGATSWPIVPDVGCRYGSIDQYFVAAVSDDQKKAILAALISKQQGGSANLTDDVTHNASFDLAMPLIGNIADVTAGLDIKKHTTVSITAGNTWRRTVNWDSIRDAHEKNYLTQTMVDHLQKKDFILAASDIIMENYTATVTIDNSISANAKAQLDDQFKALAKDSSLTVSGGGTNTGSYTVKSMVPVVVAGLYVTPPAGITLTGSTTDATKWPNANMAVRGGRTITIK